MEVDFKDFFPHTIVIEPFLGRNDYGEPIYGDATSYNARVVGKQKLVRTPSGEEKVSSSQVYIYEISNVSPEDRVTLPDGSSPPILAVAKFPDENGDHHEVVFFG
ncbi:MAG: hypothetical protein JRI54_00180 [Deltaproteobacteria bacterium]|nr:hypothetical protein [Deltaproteobacteria bacterium]